MRRVFEILTRPAHYPWIALVVAVVVLIPRLGSYGFWEPREITVADAASKWLREVQQAPGAEPGAAPTAAEPEPSPSPPVPPPRRKTGEQPGLSAEPGMAPEPGAAAAEPDPAAESGGAGEGAARKPAKLARKPRAPPEPRFTEKLVAYGVDRGGFTEWAARWPLALLGLIAVMAAYLLGARLAGRRAGLLSALVLVSSPLLILQSRQLTSDIGGLTGSALLFLGAVGMALPDRWDALRRGGPGAWAAGGLLAGDAVALVAGAILCRAADGFLLGVAPPLAGLGIGILAWALTRPDGERSWLTLAVGGAALAGAALAILFFCYDTLSWAEAVEGERHLFGWTLDADPKRLAAFGQPWKDQGDVQIPFSSAFEQIAFGLFPWVGLAPLALVRLGLGLGAADRSDARSAGAAPPPVDRDASRPCPPWAGYALFGWATVAWLLTTIVTRKVAPVAFPAVAAAAVAIGIWIDDLLARRAAAPPDRDGAVDPDTAADRDRAPGSLPLVALFVLFAALVIGKDLVSSPEELTSLVGGGQLSKYPEGSALRWPILGFGALFGLTAAGGLFLWRGPYRLRSPRFDPIAMVAGWGLHAAVGVAVLFGLFLSQVWVPGLSARMSSRDMLSRYRELRREGDKLGIVGNLGSGPTYYAGDDHVKLANRSDLIQFLKRPERVFALTRRGSAGGYEFCTLHKDATKKGFAFHVMDDRNVQFMLISNKLGPGETDENPLREIVTSVAPRPRRPLAVNFEDQIELVGVDIPAAVDRGDMVEMTFYYKILKPVTRPWKVFVHVDGGTRIGMDHPVGDGHCGLSYFQPGEYVIDRFRRKAGNVTDPTGRYRVWTGLFVGSAGMYTNMKALSGNPDPNNRILAGELQIR